MREASHVQGETHPEVSSYSKKWNPFLEKSGNPSVAHSKEIEKSKYSNLYPSQAVKIEEM